ncbi:MAG: choice-of-anchor L domain-containing protein, partial [Bacteroidota bacterium]
DCEEVLLYNSNFSAPYDLVLSLGCDDCADPKASVQAPISSRAARIETAEGTPANTLIQDVFIGGDCFDVDDNSITFTGENNARGTFSSGTDVIDIETGVLLSTGRVATAQGPNLFFNASTQLSFPITNDPDLRRIVGSGATLHDIAALEFDFTPTSDQISFEYVFASEEYCEYAGSSFNDVFGFFISGPGINGPYENGAENIARVPGSTEFVTINNLNYFSNEQYYINNVPAWHHGNMTFGLTCPSHTLDDGDFINEIEYDGFTRVLTAVANVQACETYHIKLIVADVNDGYYDSAVFLKANSFISEGTALADVEVPGFDGDTAFEDCSEGYFVFQRSNANLDDSLTVRFSVSPLSSAIAGVDYGVLPDSVVILPGDSVYYLPVEVYSDGLAEGVEDIILDLAAPCSCSMPSVRLQIDDTAELESQLEDIYLCETTNVSLTPLVGGGLAPLQYRWSTGDSTAVLNVLPQESTTYEVTITDQCGAQAIDSAKVVIAGIPTATITGYDFICAEKTGANITIEFTGAGPWQVAYRYNDTALVMIDGITENPYQFTVDRPGLYYLEAVNSQGCDGTVRGAATVFETEILLTLNYTAVSCPGKADGWIDLSVSGGIAPYQYEWNQGLGTVEDPNGLPVGSYQVTVTDDNGCTQSIGLDLPYDSEVPEVDAGVAEVLTCQQTEIRLVGSGSSGQDYSLEWTTTDGQILNGGNSFAPLIDQPGTYRLSITNRSTTCTQFDEVTVGIDTLSPTTQVNWLGPQSLDCQNKSTVLDASGSRPIGRLSYFWYNEQEEVLNSTPATPNVEINQAGLYQLEVVDQDNGCSATQYFLVESDTDLPMVAIELPGLLSCKDSLLQLDARSSEQGPQFRYEWSSPDGRLLSGLQGLQPWLDRPGTYRLTIVNTLTACENQQEVVVDIDTLPPVANAGPDQWLECDTREQVLDGRGSSQGGTYSYSWYGPAGGWQTTADPMVVEAQALGNYILEVLNLENGCRATDTVGVWENEDRPRDVVFEIEAPPCFGDDGKWIYTEVVGGLGPYLFSIDGGETYAGFDSLVLAPGRYTLYVQDANGCVHQEDFNIPNVPPLIVEAGSDVTLSLGQSHPIIAQSNVPESRLRTIRWTPSDSLDCSDCMRPLARPLNTTLYQIEITDEDGCTAQDELLLTVDKERRVYIPNAFTPNQDGINDHFNLFSDPYSVRRITRLEVFDRWGGKVYQGDDLQPNDPSSGWDGSFRGEMLNPGVFVYLAEVEFVDGFRKMYKGDVTLLSTR